MITMLYWGVRAKLFQHYLRGRGDTQIITIIQRKENLWLKIG